MAFSKPQITKKKSEQEFNLDELFGVDLSKNSSLANKIMQAIEDRMVKRTLSGKDIHGKQFKPYSSSYKKSDTFKDYKTTSKVNMDLKGDMLDSLTNDVRGNKGKVKINGQTELLKSFNHNTGDTLPKRQFFGITKKDILQNIKPKFVEELKKEKARQKQDKSKVVNESLLLAQQLFKQEDDPFTQLFRSIFESRL